METWANVLFYLVFISQIFLLSWYFPRRILGRMQHVLNEYPPSTHPKLYPKSVEYYRIGHLAFAWANRLIFGFGFGVLVAIILLDDGTVAADGYISEAWPMAYFVVQFLPLLALELLEVGQFKLMREASTDRIRTAELHRRRLLEMVSPVLVAAAAISMMLALALEVFAPGTVFEWDRTLSILGGNLLMVIIGAWIFNRRKLDPHQRASDRSQVMGAALQGVVYVIIAMNVFYMFHTLDQAFGLDYLDATMLSIYVQAIAVLGIGTMLKSVKLDQIDFSVYRESAVVSE